MSELPSSSFQNDVNSELKSPISLVYEIALKRNLNVIFDVLSEKVSYPFEHIGDFHFVYYLHLFNPILNS